MGMLSFRHIRKEEAEAAAKKKPRKNAAPAVWAVMKAGKSAALKLFKGTDYDDPEQAAKDYVDEVVSGGNTAREDLSLILRD